MSVRDKIHKFEGMEKGKSEEGTSSSSQGKKFFYPGKQPKAPAEPATVTIPQVRTKHNNLPDYEADLQEVWSVRKNIRHVMSNNVNHGTTGGSQQVGGGLGKKFCQHYSRHGAAIPAQPAAEPSKEGGRYTAGLMDTSQSLCKRSPLQEQNHFESRTWNLKTPGFSYTEGVKRPGRQSPTEGDLPPHTKRKLAVGDSNNDIPPLRQFFNHGQEQNNDKSQYAQRMVQGHLKSVGMGQYTPNASYSKHQIEKKTSWKKFEPDDFSFN